MNTKIHPKALLIFLLSLAGIMIIIYTFFNIKELYDTKVLIESELALSDGYEKEILKLNSIREKEEEIGRIANLAKIKIPAQPDEYKIIEFINGLTKDAELLGISFASRIENPVAVEMPVQISVRSDYPAMVSILEGISGAERLYSIESIDVTSSGSSAINYIITFKAYYSQ